MTLTISQTRRFIANLPHFSITLTCHATKNAGNGSPAYGRCCKVQFHGGPQQPTKRADTALNISTCQVQNSELRLLLRSSCKYHPTYLRGNTTRENRRDSSENLPRGRSGSFPVTMPPFFQSTFYLIIDANECPRTETNPTTSSKQHKTPGRRVWQLQKPSSKGGCSPRIELEPLS